MLEEMKISELVQLANLIKGDNESNNGFWEIGKNYFIRTVTMHLIGKLSGIKGKEMLLKNAVWVADSGRFYNALKDGTLSEIEPFVSDVIINRECIVDATEWLHEIPKEQK